MKDSLVHILQVFVHGKHLSWPESPLAIRRQASFVMLKELWVSKASNYGLVISTFTRKRMWVFETIKGPYKYDKSQNQRTVSESKIFSGTETLVSQYEPDMVAEDCFSQLHPCSSSIHSLSRSLIFIPMSPSPSLVLEWHHPRRPQALTFVHLVTAAVWPNLTWAPK